MYMHIVYTHVYYRTDVARVIVRWQKKKNASTADVRAERDRLVTPKTIRARRVVGIRVQGSSVRRGGFRIYGFRYRPTCLKFGKRVVSVVTRPITNITFFPIDDSGNVRR